MSSSLTGGTRSSSSSGPGLHVLSVATGVRIPVRMPKPPSSSGPRRRTGGVPRPIPLVVKSAALQAENRSSILRWGTRHAAVGTTYSHIRGESQPRVRSGLSTGVVPSPSGRRDSDVGRSVRRLRVDGTATVRPCRPDYQGIRYQFVLGSEVGNDRSRTGEVPTVVPGLPQSQIGRGGDHPSPRHPSDVSSRVSVRPMP